MLLTLQGILHDEGDKLALGAVLSLALMPIGRRVHVELQRKLSKIPLAESDQRRAARRAR
jgi:hypothetical protein